MKRLQQFIQVIQKQSFPGTYDMLHEVLKDMPHDKMYEKWAFKEYGKKLYEK